MSAVLADGWTMRAPTMADLGGTTELVVASDVWEFGESDYTEDELRGEWEGLDLATDARIVVAPAGRVAGYGAMFGHGENTRLDATVYVHPEEMGRGVGTTLVRWTEARGRERAESAPAGTRVVLNNFINGRNADARSLLDREGYEVERHFWRMIIDLDEAPPPAVWPAGIEVHAVATDAEERAAYAAVDEAFQDHWGHTPTTFEEWNREMRQDGFEPRHWYAARDGEEIAGVVIGGPRAGMGWIRYVSVRRPWRRQGMGLALLRHAFGMFQAEGTRTVGLGVDAQNPTGATRLYEGAGMRAVHEYAAYQKVLRPGRALGEKTNET